MNTLAAGTTNGTTTTSDDAERVSTDEFVSQSTDVVGQGSDGDVVAEDGARLWRTSNAILMEVSMPRPTPGEYTYPSAPEDKEGEWWTDEVGDLEAFTLWAFIFNNPGDCEDGCGSDDVGDPAGGGVFGVTGHIFDGNTLTLAGMVTTDTETFDGASLARPMEQRYTWRWHPTARSSPPCYQTSSRLRRVRVASGGSRCSIPRPELTQYF